MILVHTSIMNHTSVDYMNIVPIRQTASTWSFIPPAPTPALIAVPISEFFIPTKKNMSLNSTGISLKQIPIIQNSKYDPMIPSPSNHQYLPDKISRKSNTQKNTASFPGQNKPSILKRLRDQKVKLPPGNKNNHIRVLPGKHLKNQLSNNLKLVLINKSSMQTKFPKPNIPPALL